MKPKKLIRYAVPVSQRFPSTHCRKGEATYFVEQIMGLFPFEQTNSNRKLHTIRNNKNNVWTKRMKKVLEGKAVIDLFYWKLPGGRWTKDNEQIVFATLDKDSGCGVQELGFTSNEIEFPKIDTSLKSYWINIGVLAKNDGLTIDEFKSWFKGYDLSEPLAIIHFTKFRY